MTKQAQIDRLRTLRAERVEWDHTTRNDRLTASVGELTLHVDRITNTNPMWQVEGERNGVIIPWTPANTVTTAIQEACDFARAHLLGQTEEQHAV